MKQILQNLKEQAQELIDGGNGHEKARGQGMMEVIDALNSTEAKQERRIEKAMDILCDSEDEEGNEITIPQQIALIENEEDETTIIDNIEGVNVWEKLQNFLTCKDFLDLIGDYE